MAATMAKAMPAEASSIQRRAAGRVRPSHRGSATGPRRHGRPRSAGGEEIERRGADQLLGDRLTLVAAGGDGMEPSAPALPVGPA